MTSSQEDASLDPGDMMSMWLQNFLKAGGVPLKKIAANNRELVRVLRDLDPLIAAATVGGLLTRPELQANCLCLEALAHLVIRYADGSRKPNREMVSRAFSAVGNRIGHLEDPSEDLFMDLVPTRRGNFRVLSGLAEGGAFYLTRFMNVVDRMPPREPFDRMKEEIYSLLKLSECVACRSGVPSSHLGSEVPLRQLPPSILGILSECRRAVIFTDSELSTLGISRQMLAAFAFDPEARESLDDDSLGNSLLERAPVLITQSGVILALPTAVTVAVRRYVIETCMNFGLDQELFSALVNSHTQLLRGIPLLGDLMNAPVIFRDVGGAMLAPFMTEIDPGRWLHVVAFADDFDGYHDNALAGVNPNQERLGAILASEVESAARHVADGPAFRTGLTVIIGCGWGRSLCWVDFPDQPNWRVVVIPAHDLVTLSSLDEFRPTTLVRTLDMENKLKSLGVRLENVNGLLNLIAWARGLDEHLVPHGNLPDGFITEDSEVSILIEQNALRKIRHEVAVGQDCRRLQDTEGRWVSVRRSESIFAEDRARAAYFADEDVLNGQLLGAVVTARRTWWVQLVSDGSRSITLEHWKMLHGWLGESAPIFEEVIPGLPEGPILWSANFEGLKESLEPAENPDIEALEKHLVVDVVPSKSAVRIRVDPEFQTAFHHPENVAERLLVRFLLLGTARLAGADLSSIALSNALERIVRNPQARHIHMFNGRGFRDQVAGSLPRRHIEVTRQDVANLSLGLGWRARARTEPRDLEGKDVCTAFLNSTVKQLEAELCHALSEYSRRPFVEHILLNYEAAAKDRDHWARTSSALLGLRRNRLDTMRVIAEREASRNAVFQGSRILVEAAVCECPDAGRNDIGELDMSRLMALANSIVMYGGWSNAIHWDAMEPHLVVSPLGDIMTASKFDTSVLAPFGQAGIAIRTEHEVSSYARHYDPPGAPVDVDTVLDSAFLSAWISEFGFSIETARIIMEALEDYGVEHSEAVYVLPRSELMRVVAASFNERDATETFIESLSLKPRIHWSDIPDGYKPRDREPWRYRRRLSLLRLPFVQLDVTADPLMMVAPGIIREALLYLIRGFHDGDFDKTYATAPDMRSWIGAANNKRGHEFNVSVADRMRELGWEAEPDVQVTRLLRKGFQKDFGDVDVLAWHSTSGRVLLIECKDLQLRKTHGEVAEQLFRFRGEIGEDGRPDLLRKHLDRVAVVMEHLAAVKSFTRLRPEPQIECHVVFRNPVPMQFAWERLGHRARLSIFSDLAEI